MTAKKVRQKKSEPTLAEQLAALEKLRALVRQIEAERAEEDAGSGQKVAGKNKPPFKAA
jgi:hypothetical protein